MRIAAAIWEDKISPLMDTASRLLIIDRSTPENTTRYEAAFFGHGIWHRTKFIVGHDVEVLLCGAISRPFKNMLCANGVQVVNGLSGSIETIMDAYLTGNLDRSVFFMPGCDKAHFKLCKRRQKHMRGEKND